MLKHLKYTVKGTLSIIGFMWAPLLIAIPLAYLDTLWPGTLFVVVILFICWFAGTALST